MPLFQGSDRSSHVGQLYAVVDGLSAAKMALELKDYDTLDNVLSETLERASAIVSDLLGSRVRTEGLAPGDLRR